MASLSGKVETNIEVKSSAEKIYQVFFDQPPPTRQVSGPVLLQSCDLLEGDWGKEGSIICFNYTQDGVPMVLKEKVESVDQNNKSITYKVIEGDILKDYKSLVVTIQVSPKSGGGGGSIVNWAVEYEKLTEQVTYPPEAMLQSGIQFCQGIDASLA